ncbi:hypothetical protein D0Z07_2913 [Hyphodiscus hymeniophilus]|uniref:Uncharacterized protein n=1 Tax=Hyphodiscus hymeniophilus TaxID=353542 RepID=A0A9P7AYK8_9HELO|nr:hypothetical protein D0Z07_2913 [Hyphodiscus hymeniophilus]
MAPHTGWEAGRLTRATDATKIFIKKFGPLLITGLAAVAEHHWLGHDDEPEDTKMRDEENEPEDRTAVRKLEREVRELKRSLSRKARNNEQERESRPEPINQANMVEERRSPYRDTQSDELYVRDKLLPEGRQETKSYGLYQQVPVTQTMPTPRKESPAQVAHVQERDQIRPSHRQHSIQRQRRRRRHRLPSASHRSFHENEFSEREVHAGKVAAIAGAVETIHMSGEAGEWIGRKGVRVGTTMAASYAASRSRDGNPDDFRPREVVVDVGTGLLVSRLVHGSKRRLEDDERAKRRGRR